MNAFSRKLYDFSLGSIKILSLFFTGILFLGGFLTTCYAVNMETQQVLTRLDHPLWNLLMLAVFLAFFFLMERLVCRNVKKRLPLLLLLVLAWCAALGGVLILFSKTVPAADAMSVYAIAESLAAGDTSVIHPTDSYLSYYPQQIGLTAFFELLIRLWNLLPLDLPAYHMIKGIYVLLACAVILLQYRTVHLLFQNERADCIYLLLAGANMPLIMYTSFVYGEIPSFAALSGGIYLLLKFLLQGKPDPKRLICGAGSLFFLTLSVFLRKNSLVLIIAILLVVLFQWLKEKRHSLLLFALLCAFCSLTVLPATQKLYERRADSTLKSGVPAMSYFAMGMQESSRGKGWYNGFNFNTYQETGMDTKKTAAVSKAAIEERLSYFKEHPGYAADFYLHKYLEQWADGTYACRQATLATFGGRQPFFDSLYAGSGSRYFIGYCNGYQNVIYLGCFLFFLIPLIPGAGSDGSRKTNREFPVYLGLIGAFGGFLFHMIWEANSRYIFLYGLLLLPYAAQGLTLSASYLTRRFSQKPEEESAL